MSKSRTTPFTSLSSAKGFANKVSGKITTQTNNRKEVHHVHYKSDGIYRGSKQVTSDEGSDFDSSLNREGTHWHDSSDL